MLSFFSKKKPSPDATPVTVIQGPVDPSQAQQNNGGDDFIFIERRPGADNPQDATTSHMYPPMPTAVQGNNYNPGLVYPPPPTIPAINNKQQDNTIASYLQDVPFTLAPQLCTMNNFALTQMEVDGMLALMTRQMSVDEHNDYNFALERAIQSECY